MLVVLTGVDDTLEQPGRVGGPVNGGELGEVWTSSDYVQQLHENGDLAGWDCGDLNARRAY